MNNTYSIILSIILFSISSCKRDKKPEQLSIVWGKPEQLTVACEKPEPYPFTMEINGPFTIKDILKSGDVFYKKGIITFNENDSVYVVKINNTNKDTLYVRLDLQTGLLMGNTRDYSDKQYNGKYKLMCDYGIQCNFEALLIDTILPNQSKKYYTGIFWHEGVTEICFPIRSTTIDSLNALTHKDRSFYPRYPFVIYHSKNGNSYQRLDERSFYDSVQVYGL